MKQIMYIAPNDYLVHHGVKGQKWGIRRFQNADGTLTPEGKSRYESAGYNTAKLAKEKRKMLKEAYKDYKINNPNASLIKRMKARNAMDYQLTGATRKYVASNSAAFTKDQLKRGSKAIAASGALMGIGTLANKLGPNANVKMVGSLLQAAGSGVFVSSLVATAANTAVPTALNTKLGKKATQSYLNYGKEDLE